MTIKIMLWNARRWHAKKEEIIKRIQDYDISIITEIKNKRDQHYYFTGYTTITKNNYSNE